jgi:XisH protein
MAKDVFHYAVRKGLEKEGWLITDNPLSEVILEWKN